MSLSSINQQATIDPFPSGKNIRVKITGLALCNFNLPLSTIRFLRHVKHHELLMKITQMKTDMTDKKTIVVKIGAEQNIKISAPVINSVSSFIHEQQSFDQLIKLKKLHHPHALEDKPNKPQTTTLELEHCAFYGHKITTNSYFFENQTGAQTTSPQQYCEILGGYLSYKEDASAPADKYLTIRLLNDGLDLTYPLPNFLYEIEFSNSCDTTPSCGEEEDFRFIYDIVREKRNPGYVFKMKGPDRTINTGACLPVCENCS